jgi:twitching motility protein PilT
MIVTASIQEAIMFNQLDRVWEYIRNGSYDGMCTMDDSIFQAYSSGLIDGDTAQAFALNKDEMSRVLRGAHS